MMAGFSEISLEELNIEYGMLAFEKTNPTFLTQSWYHPSCTRREPFDVEIELPAASINGISRPVSLDH